MKLRPVRFHYKQDVDRPASSAIRPGRQEEVAKVYPDLVVFDENGQPQTVRYHFVNAMLLNEVRRQARVEPRHNSVNEGSHEIEAQRRKAIRNRTK